MAATIAATPDIAQLRIGWLGFGDEDATNTVAVDGAALDADIEQFFDDLQAVSNAGLAKASASFQRAITGLTAEPAYSSVLSAISVIVVLTFVRAHPLNSGIELKRSFQLRAPAAGIYGSDGKPIVASVVGDRSSIDEKLRGLIDFLEDNMVYADPVSETVTVGGWTYSPTRSGLVTGNAVIGDGV